MKLEQLSKVKSQNETCRHKIVNVSDFCRPRMLKIFALNGNVSQHDLTTKGMDYSQKGLIF